ncbi:transcriptional repressor ILP1 [Hordeum vulgare subsp. vulgare]|uniref:GCF C-terminal domain-containing protein n=1 Tax=Hordeum vulgare subsp. vulgare TaxID=112509 RepID=A0A8I6XNU6_HORVV|nr:transcriptional repressor ILP1 [Hordeum vulgare subsp. vulgare]
MSSHRKNFRRRTDDDDGGKAEDAGPASRPSSKAQPPPAPPKPRSSRLSFADEEDDEDDAEEGPFAQQRTRRPSASVSQARTASPAAAALHRVTPARDRVRSSPAVVAPVPKPSNFQSHAGEYTPERLRELQKNARPLPGSLMRAPAPPPPPPLAAEPRHQRIAGAAASSSAAPTTAGKAVPAEPVVVLKGLVKPMAQASIGPRRPLPNEVQDGDSEEEAEDDGDGEEKGPLIPDKATIEAIRAKRQQLQQPRHAAPDFISLDGGGVLSSRKGAAGGSSDEDDNEIEGRIAMYSEKQSDGQRSSKGVFQGINNRGPAASLGVMKDRFMEVEDDEVDDEEEEERKWEEAQVKKALGNRMDDSSSHQRATNGVSAARQQVQPQPSGGPHYQPSFSGVVPGASVFASGSAEFLSISQQADVAGKALQENIRKLRETHKTTVDSLARTDTHLNEALSEISSLESGLQDAEKKFVYMQELRNYISVMCDFLNDKAFFIEELEEHMQKLHENRALAVSERRAADFADESAVIEAAVSAAISVLSKGPSSANLSAATHAAQAAAAAARESSNLPPELDEFGRDINLQKRMDLKRREENRRRRKARSESKRLSSARKSVTEHIEGELSTDESDTDTSAYLSSRDELLKTADAVFGDAAEEYSSLTIVKDKFEGWKTQYPLAYRDAHVSLSAPSVFTPYVRLELLNWDPLHETTSFFDMQWTNVLVGYGVQDEDSADPNDLDLNLIQVLAEKVALPVLHHRIKHCWDILSTQRTQHAVDATFMVINYVPLTSKALHQLLATVCSRLTEAIADVSVPAWGSMLTRAVPGAAEYAAYRFGVATRLLKNVCLWKKVLAGDALERLAVEELLIGKVLPHMKSIILEVHDAITRAERVAASLSGVWSSPNKKLQPFTDFVLELSNKLKSRHISGVSEEEIRGLARRLKNILVALNEYDKARNILKTFQIREAL